jgi:small subunit ribosomal protein S17
MSMSDRGARKTQTGIVVSDKMQKTVVVKVNQLVKHPVYSKYMRRTAKYKAHDEMNMCKLGDRVLIVETRPLSKDKCWKIKEIISSLK